MKTNVCKLSSFAFLPFCLFALIGNSVSARTLGSLGAETQNLTNDIKFYNVGLTEIEGELQTVEALAKKLKDESDASEDERAKAAGILPSWLGGGTGDRNANANAREAKNKLEVINGKVAALEKKKAGLELNSRAVRERMEDVNIEVKESHKAVLALIDKQGLTGRFDAVKAKIGSVDGALNILSQRYDQSLIGAYLKDKIGLLLNSPVMCDAVKECRDGRASANVANDKVQKALFPNSASSTRKKQYFNKANGVR